MAPPPTSTLGQRVRDEVLPRLPPGVQCKTFEEWYSEPDHRRGARARFFEELTRGPVVARTDEQIASGTKHATLTLGWSGADAVAELELRIHNPSGLPLESLFDRVELETGGMSIDRGVFSWALPALCHLHGRPAPYAAQGDVTVVPLPLRGTHLADAFPHVQHHETRVRVTHLAPAATVVGLTGLRLRRRDDAPPEAFPAPRFPRFDMVSHGSWWNCDTADYPRDVSASGRKLTIRINGNHPVRALLVGGLDAGRVRSAHLVLDGVAVGLVDPVDVGGLSSVLGAADASVAEEAARRARAARLETVGDVLVFRLCDVPLDTGADPDPGRMINLSRVDRQELVVELEDVVPDPPPRVRAVAVCPDLLVFRDGLAGATFMS